MDKRGAKILISCILCTVIVSILFLLAFRISRLTCELVSVEPQRLRVAQLEAFDKKRNKPIRSHDKMMLMKISAYLEYNIMQKDDDNDEAEEKREKKRAKTSGSTTSTTSRPAPLRVSPTPPALANSSQTMHLNANAATQPNGHQAAGAQHPSPSQPQLAFSSQQLANSSFARSSGSGGGSNSAPMHQRAKRRFLPLELESIETRDKGTEGSGAQAESRQKYILSFNCTKLNMVFVYRSNKVFVESMRLELKPTSNHKSICDLEMPRGLFEVYSAAGQSNGGAASKSDHFAHYFCNKPLVYSCRHYSQHGPSSANGLLLAELHINALEFETATLAASSHGAADRKHVKNEFKSRRSECSAAA